MNEELPPAGGPLAHGTGPAAGEKLLKISADDPAAEPSGGAMNGMDAVALLKEAEGYWRLGLYAEAEAALRRAMAGPAPAREEAGRRLVKLFYGLGRLVEAAALGGELISRGQADYGTVIDTMLALAFDGRPGEGREALRKVVECGHPLEEDAYQMACFASCLGEFHDALRWLVEEVRGGERFAHNLPTDSDLIPLWEWLRGHAPTLEEAHWLLELPLERLCEQALAPRADLSLSPGDVARLPEREQRLFHYDWEEGALALHAGAAAADRGAADAYFERRRRDIAAVRQTVAAARARALEVVLDAQPRYAAAHAARGNHLGARWHLLWLINRRPAAGPALLEEKGLELMRPFLGELLAANAADPGFGRRMEEAADVMAQDPDRAWLLLEQTPARLRQAALYLCRQGSLAFSEDENEKALAICGELRRRWPQDAAGWLNAVKALRALGRDMEALEMLRAAPGCCRSFRVHWLHLAGLEPGVPLRYPCCKERAFLGQPDLGGLLIADSELQPQDRPGVEPIPL